MDQPGSVTSRDLSDTDEMEEDYYDSDATNMSVELPSSIVEDTEEAATEGENEPESNIQTVSIDGTEYSTDEEGSPVLFRSQRNRNYPTRPRRRILEIHSDSEESVVVDSIQIEPSTTSEPPGEPQSPPSSPVIHISQDPDYLPLEPESHVLQPRTESGSAFDHPTTSNVGREGEAMQNPPGCSSTRTPPSSPQKSVPAIPNTPESEDEGQNCTICFEPWSNSGNHRLVSLKCGHFFGQACIAKWLKGPKGKCPQCNAKATKKDIRIHFVKNLKAIDTAERDRIQQDLDKEREARRRQEVDHAQTKLKYELKTQLVVKLQEELKALRNSTAEISSSQGHGSFSGGGNSHGKFRLQMHSGMDVMKDGGCRVMAYNEWLSMLVVSVPSQVAMFPGYGVKKINVLDMKLDRYVPLHQKQIRDIAFNPVKNDLLLSVGMDKIIKLTNICSNTQVASYQAESPLWSCCWSTDDANLFFVGTASGSIIQYDTRNTSTPVQTINVAGHGPVVSLKYISYCCTSNFPLGGLLVARLQSCSFVELKESGAQDHVLPLEGPFTSVSLEASTRHILVSCRPSQKFPHARHLVCELQIVDISTDLTVQNRIVTSNVVHTFKGGTTLTILSRSYTMVNPKQTGSVLACASDESMQSTCIWDLATTSCLQQIKCPEIVIDIISVKNANHTFFTLLTDKSLKFYKFVDS